MTTLQESEAFYGGAEERILRFFAAAGVAALAGVWVWRGWAFAGGFAFGAVIAYANLVWLKKIVQAFAEHSTGTGRGGSGFGVALRFVVRYAFITVLAYAIFKSSVVSVYGFFAGLFLPVVALTCEAVYETYVALRRGL